MSSRLISQRKFVEDELVTFGSITRNECIREYITRLSSIICDMNKNGYVIEASRISTVTRWGKGYDYKYTIIKKPKNRIY